MHARDLMTPNPFSVCSTDSIKDAAAKMASCDVGSMPVLETRDSGRLVGVLTDRDIVIRCVAKDHDTSKCTVEQHMTSEDLATVRPEELLAQVVEKMERAKVRRIPVVDGDNKLCGIVAQADLARCVGPDNPRLVEEVLLRVSAPGQSIN